MHTLTTLRRLLPLAALSSLSLAAATTCTATTPWVQSFNSNASLGSIQNHTYVTDVNTVTNNAGKYTFWNSIDHTGNGGYALYLNVANFENKNGALLTTPRVLFQQTVTVPAGSKVTYQNYARTHANTPSQLRYEFTDPASSTLLASMNGSVLTTGYTLQKVPEFTAPGTQVTVKVLTLKDGVNGDANVLKLDDLKLSCVPQTQLTITKGSNGPWTVGQSGATYTLTVKNSGSATTSGAVTVKDQLPAGISAPASFTPATGWTCTTSGSAVTCTGTPNLSAGSSVALTVPVTVGSGAVGTITNRASVGGGGDPDPIPDPASCTTTGGQCAATTTTVTTPTPPAVTGTCTVSTPFRQTFDTNASSGEIRNHTYRSDPNTVTATDGTYTFWRDIDRTGNGGYALYMNIANFEGKNGGALTTPGLLYEQKINVPAGSELTYSNWVRSHSSTATQLRYVFRDAGGALLKQFDGAVAGTGYTQQTVPTFTVSGTQVTLQILTLKDGTSADTNVLKLDDLNLACPVPPRPSLTITKTSNGPWTVGQTGATYTLTVKNGSAVNSTGTVTVKDQLPSGISAPASFTPATGWSCTTSGSAVTCTGTPNLNAGSSVALTVPVTVGVGAVGTITNRASVGGGGDPDPIPDPGTCTTTGGQCATTTTTVTTPAPAPVCSKVYALNIAPGGNNLNGVTINELDVTTNTVGAQIAALSDSLSTSPRSATLGISPDAKRFFVATDDNRLQVYDTSLKAWYSGGTFSGVSGRLVRMAVTSTGVGYAMDGTGNIWSFTTASSSGYVVTPLGLLTSTSSGAPSFRDNGDFFADSSGKLYMISAVTGSTSIDLWLITPAASSASAEYLGSFSNPAQDSQFAGIAAAPSGIYARDNLGRLVKLDLVNVTYTPVGTASLGSTDLASCTYPVLAPSLNAVKSVTKVAGTSGDKVQPGDTLEYRVVIRNSGTLPAGGVTFSDALPAGTTYVPGSARVNGATTTVTNGSSTSLSGAYPFAQPVGICSGPTTPCTTQVLRIDSTPGTLDNEAVVTFRVTVNLPASYPADVRNTALIRFTGGPNGGVPSNEVVTPVYQPAKLTVVKTVQNVTAGGPVGTTGEGNPGDVLEYCIATTNVGGLNATNITFSDVVPANTAFQVGGFAAGQDIKVTTPAGTVYYTAAADGDAGLLSGGKVTVQAGSFVLAPAQTVTFCFRASIQ
ncbi:DUF11 domain-containing protein [Deinococcus sp. JMULE3]|uniref:DUF11 domain-containing protein n=1 Tax=Deinococcus sp. JMULE3 TaxID=2518341 RepID=UPI001576CB83|nr:DUF11 domain-containing protein [Deinococcus sp. JMULE3]NTY00729.1 DUF11 domain-containing protein [Deinococcus sp. JMULE3]